MKKLCIDNCHILAESKNGQCLDEIYITNHSKYRWLCNICSYIWQATYHSVDSGSWCPYCAGKVKHTIGDCQLKAKAQGGRCLSTTINNVFEKLTWECTNNHIFKMRYHNVDCGQWCPVCNKPPRRTLKDACILAASKGISCISETFETVNDKLKWKCPEGHMWEATYVNIKRGTGCPDCCQCNRTQALLKKILEEILQEHAITNCRKFVWLKNKGRMEIDIWFPNLKLAIEYDGEQHFISKIFFGGERGLKRRQKMDKLKDKLIQEHQEEIAYFIRFNYLDKITKESVLRKLQEANIPIPI